MASGGWQCLPNGQGPVSLRGGHLMTIIELAGGGEHFTYTGQPSDKVVASVFSFVITVHIVDVLEAASFSLGTGTR